MNFNPISIKFALPKGSLEQRELSAKLTEGLSRLPLYCSDHNALYKEFLNKGINNDHGQN